MRLSETGQSEMNQNRMKCGLLGEKLGHSYSPRIHGELADYEYLLYEKRPEEVESFVPHGDWHGLNVTIPYKKTVIPFCDSLTDMAREIGSVNTLLRREDGSILGDNTDAYGFRMLLDSVLKAAGDADKGTEEKDGSLPESGSDKALVLGTGGASVTVQAVLRSRGYQVVPISRSGEDNYENIGRHSDAVLLVNTTPLGMYPKNGEKATDLRLFPRLRAVLDVVYNPARTALMLQAEELGIPAAGGLKMLVAQAWRAAEIFLGRDIPETEMLRIERQLSTEMRNLILIGMPGSGKSTVARILGERLGRVCVEADEELENQAGMSIPEIFRLEGEEGFRRRETEILRELGKRSGIILSTGGGCVVRPENYPLLHQNGIIVRIARDTAKLARAGRPLSLNADLEEMYRTRNPLYERFADFTVSNDGRAEDTAEIILEVIS